MSRRRAVLALALGLLAVAVLLLGEQGWLAVKAQVARRLIDDAWTAHLDDGRHHRPWRWADTHPLARLEVPRLGVQRTVLAGATGSSLAFGPGHVDGTAAPNRPGNCAVAGHRDSWFAFLRELREGDRVWLGTRDRRVAYRVSHRLVSSMHDAQALAPTAGTRLTLVTCWPFDDLRRGAWRYVVICEPEAALSRSAG